jgi:hypothetical protein
MGMQYTHKYHARQAAVRPRVAFIALQRGILPVANVANAHAAVIRRDCMLTAQRAVHRPRHGGVETLTAIQTGGIAPLRSVAPNFTGVANREAGTASEPPHVTI